MKKYITEAALERMRPPAEGRVELGDTVVPGLMLRVTAGGVMSWSVLYKVRGEGGLSQKTGRPLRGAQRRITLGTYPILGSRRPARRQSRCSRKPSMVPMPARAATPRS